MNTRFLAVASLTAFIAVFPRVVVAGPPSEGGAQPAPASTGSQAPPSGVSIFGPPAGGEYSPDTTGQAGVVNGKIQRPTDSTAGPSGNGYDIIDPAIYQQVGIGNATPDYHIVQKGDTLWDICTYYFGDPYLWPQIWSLNEQVTNAHWIFPGDRVRLTEPYTVRPSEGTGLSLSETEAPPSDNDTYVLNRFAYIDDEEYQKSMTVSGGAQAKVMMSKADTAYVKYDPENPPIPGERLAVYRPQRAIYDVKVRGKNNQRQTRGKRLGYLVEVVGEVYVTKVAKNSAEVVVVDSVAPVERGMRVGELQTRFSRITEVDAESTEVGLVIDTIQERKLAGDEQFVVINLGATRGIRRGNMVDVVHKGDEYTADHQLRVPYDDGHPRRVIAQVLIVQVQEKTALGVVTYSRRELVKGDHVELRPPPENAQTNRSRQAGGEATGRVDGNADPGSVEGSAQFKLGN